MQPKTLTHFVDTQEASIIIKFQGFQQFIYTQQTSYNFPINLAPPLTVILLSDKACQTYMNIHDTK